MVVTCFQLVLLLFCTAYCCKTWYCHHFLLMCFHRTVVFFNPLAQRRTEVVYVIVDTVNIQVTNAEDVAIPCQINPVLDRSSLIADNQFQVCDCRVFWPFLIICSLLPFRLVGFYRPSTLPGAQCGVKCQKHFVRSAIGWEFESEAPAAEELLYVAENSSV